MIFFLKICVYMWVNGMMDLFSIQMEWRICKYLWVDLHYDWKKNSHSCVFPVEDTTPGHTSQPGSSSVSPRAVTPKRGPPSLVYNSHSSSLTSPPVVTIAPTQAHPTIPSTETKQVYTIYLTQEKVHWRNSNSFNMQFIELFIIRNWINCKTGWFFFQ